MSIRRHPHFEMMMSRSFTFFLATLVLMHATFGCCIHHVHSCEVDCCDAPAATAGACPCGSHEEEDVLDSSELAQHSNHGHDPHRCEDEPCSFVAFASSNSDLDSIFSQPTATLSCITDADIVVSVSIAAEHKKLSSVVSAAPRLHLVLSVLLI